MRISGFTFARNASKLYYPVKAAITSILPLVNEFVVALGDNDPDDDTEKEILSIDSPKIKIIRTKWDLEKFPYGMEYARQTDIAMRACTGDWLFYIQSDEVLHEKYFSIVKDACEKYLHEPTVEGFLFSYKHFWGDYNHYVVSHAWYPREIRIIRNDPQIHSWRDAQSFRRIPAFDGSDYYQKKGTNKLSVVPINACIHHYGFVRPPAIMQKKNKNHHANYRGLKAMIERFKNRPEQFEYGDLNKLQLYQDEHPQVMKEWIAKMDWSDVLQLPCSRKALHKHDLPKYKLLTFIEQRLLQGRQLFGFRNYKLTKRKIFPSSLFG